VVIMHTVSLFTQSIAKFIEIDKRLLAVVSSEQEERSYKSQLMAGVTIS
jgi:hypothetical protein